MYKVIIDSCGELTEELKEDGHFINVPLVLEVDGECIVDDETFNQAEFIRKIKASEHAPKSSCPSPELYMKEFECDAKRIYIVTLSGRLSGSYNSAVLAQNMYEEAHPGEKQIYVFNSRSASVGETLIGYKIFEYEKKGLEFREIVEKTEQYIKSMNTFFVLETLDTLRKAGRLTGIKFLIADSLNIKPVMGATEEGTICQLGQARGMKKALHKMVEYLVETTKNCEERILGVAFCNCEERAQMVINELKKLTAFKKIVMVNTAGVSTMYANEGGIILTI